MKRLLFLCIGLVFVSCKNEPKDYVSLSGKIDNSTEDKIVTIFQGKAYSKKITINDDGSFSDTLNITPGIYMFKHGNQYGELYMENGNTLSFTTDYSNFDKALKFEGDNKEKNTFFIEKVLLQQSILDGDLMDRPEEEYKAVMNTLKEKYNNLKLEYKSLNDSFFTSQDEKLERMVKMYNEYYQSRIDMRKALPEGSPSPQFVDYENHKGGTSSLNDFKGKYVYIDVWATWCGPCIAEIPALKDIEKKYHDKNIAFVSISIDKEPAYEKWKKMVNEKELGGVQLLADSDWKSQFVLDYKINGIPRFILIDPEGSIVNADAPRPSSSKLIDILNALEI